MAYRASIIKSIQRGTITVASGALTGTATITAVVTAASVVSFGGESGDAGLALNAGNVRGVFFDLQLTNTTTVTATTGANVVTTTINIPFQVIEFYPSVLTANGVQRGTTTLTAAASATSTITSVTTTKAWIVWAGYRLTINTAFGGGGNTGNILITQTLTNGTTVTVATNGSDTSSAVVPYQVVEFK